MSRGIIMLQVKEILRLHFELNLSQQQIAQSLKLSCGCVNKYLKKFVELGYTWPVADAVLHNMSSNPPATVDYAEVHTELKSYKYMTLQLIWEEYAKEERTKLSYSHFARLYREWKKTQSATMRQVHIAGEKVFVDYAGPTVSVFDSETGVLKQAHIFVGVLGASNYTYFEASWSQQLMNWIEAHVRMFNHFGGVVSLIVPDNLRSAVAKADRYEPDINSAYADFARHYGVAIYEFKYYKRGFVGNDYHIELLQHYYSVPYQYIRQYTDIWYNDRIVQIYIRNKLVASHTRSINNGQTSLPDHMPVKHKKYVEWTEERCLVWAKSIGVAALGLVEQMLTTTHSENARRSCLGLMGLAKHYGNERLEAACSYALQVGAFSRKYLVAILDNKLDQVNVNDNDKSIPLHKNIRGGGYYA